MDDRIWERWASAGGILFVVLVAVSAFLPGSPPMSTDPASEIAKFIRDNNGTIRWAGYLGGLAAIPLLWWLGSVWRLLRRAEGGSPRLTVVAIAGAVFAALFATLGGVILAAIPIIGLKTLHASGARTAYIVSTNLTAASEFGMALFVGAFSVLILRTRVLPVVLGWAGGLIALVALAGGAAVATTRDAIFGIAFLLWVIAVSAFMLRGPREAIEIDVVVADVSTA